MNRNVDYLLGGLLGVALILAAWREWLPYSLTETLGFVTGAACVYLVVRRNIWNFPLGIANNLFFLVLFGQARLYGDAGLHSSTSPWALRAGSGGCAAVRTTPSCGSIARRRACCRCWLDWSSLAPSA